MQVKYGAQLFILSAYERVDNSVAIAKYDFYVLYRLLLSLMPVDL